MRECFHKLCNPLIWICVLLITIQSYTCACIFLFKAVACTCTNSLYFGALNQQREVEREGQETTMEKREIWRMGEKKETVKKDKQQSKRRIKGTTRKQRGCKWNQLCESFKNEREVDNVNFEIDQIRISAINNKCILAGQWAL